MTDNRPWHKLTWSKATGELIKGMISMRRLILSYTIQEVVPIVCMKFQNPRYSSS